MDNSFKCKSLNIHTTTVCTLKCAKCGWSFPLFSSPVNADFQKTVDALEQIFNIYDYIEEVRFAGAEAFLYSDIEKLMIEISKYREQFEYAILITNGTYIPKQSIIHTMQNVNYPLLVRVDNYGELSKKYKKVIEILQAAGIKVDERLYTGDDQAFGGWVDLGNYTDKHYTDEQLLDVFRRCRLPEAAAMLVNDKLINCAYAAAGTMLGKVVLKSSEVIDLSEEHDIEKIRKNITAWRNTPFEACKYCNGNDPERSPRIPAAVQL